MNKLLLFTFLLLGSVITAQTEYLLNGSFEDGDIGEWSISEINGVSGGICNENWTIFTDSAGICCCVDDVLPTNGNFGAFTGFDSSSAPDTQWIIEQPVFLPNFIASANVSFDFIGNFDFSLGAPITIPRELIVQIVNADDSSIISEVFSDQYTGTGFLSVDYSQDIDITADLLGFENTNVIVRFIALIPETGTGPGKVVLDNVSFLIDDVLGLNDEKLKDEISIFPNPSNGTFTMNYQGTATLEKSIVYDLTGKVVTQLDLSGFNNSKTINTNLSRGIYLLETQSNLGSKNTKLIIR